MATGPAEFPALAPIAGVRLGTANAGIKTTDRPDVLVVEISKGSTTAAVFTQNAFCAAPVIVAKRHLKQASPRYLLVNSGNANAGTGEPGIGDALFCCVTLSAKAGVSNETVLPFSTGVIGEALPVAKVQAASGEALNHLTEDGWYAAATAIMTTDTRPKGATRSFEHRGKAIHLSGIAKGAGMICPNMATLLVFLATDISIAREQLQTALGAAVEKSFNRITIDGDTSTNDAAVLIASGKAGNETILSESDPLYLEFATALDALCNDLARQIVRDGEGATKFVTIEVVAGESSQECLRVGRAVAHSPLVKTALFASDPNWGRILAAVGRAGVKQLDIQKIRILLDEVCIVERGAVSPGYSEEQGQAVMNREDITIRIELGRGDAEETLWTSDLSHEYVSINADYRT